MASTELILFHFDNVKPDVTPSRMVIYVNNDRSLWVSGVAYVKDEGSLFRPLRTAISMAIYEPIGDDYNHEPLFQREVTSWRQEIVSVAMFGANVKPLPRDIQYKGHLEE